LKRAKNLTVLVIIISLTLTYLQGSGNFITSLSATMLPGTRGDEVKQLQQRLKNWGYYKGEAHGSYNWDTFLAVKDFQYCYGLKPTGIAGTDTQFAMGLTKIVKNGVVLGQGNGVGQEHGCLTVE